ncbi:MAG TPA: DUF6603 domain-containing protein [Chthoniobacterales bacterium]
MAESTLQGLIGEIKEFLEWIKDTLEDDEARKSLLEDVGLEPTDPPPKPNVPQDKLDSIGRYQQTVDADKAALDSTLSDLRAVFDSVRSFISSFSLSPALVGEVTNRFLNLLALNYIRLRKPKLFVAAQAVSFVEDTGAPFLSGKITWKNIVKVCTDGGFYLLKTILIALDDEEEAQARSDFYFVPLGAFLAFAFKPNNRSLYGWDPAPESGTPQGDAISRRMLSSVFFTTERDANGQTIEKRINTSLYFLSTPQGGPGLFLTLGGSGALDAPLSKRWKALLEVSSPSVVDMTFFGEKVFTIRGPLGGPPDVRASVALQSIPDQTNRSFVLPSDSDTHFEVGTVELVATVSANEIDLDATEAEIKLSLNDCAVVIATKDNDGFLASLLPAGGLRFPFNFGLGASTKRGLFTEGNVPFLSGRSTRALGLTRAAPPNGKPPQIAGAIGKGFSVSIPVGVALGPLELHSLQLKLAANDTTPDTSDVVAEASASLILRLGPAYISIDRLGFELKLAFPEKGIGNLGLADLSLGPALPRGVAISIESSAVTGGGFLFLDQQRGVYAGAVQLSLEGGLSVSALGIIATRLPDGTKGFSLLVIITAEGFKPIQLGLGFKLTGLGGMLAINRTFNEEVLCVGVKNHTLDAVLFPANPVRDALQLLSGLNKIFPIAPGHHLFGPMVEIEWATPTLVTMQLGIVLEIGERLRLLVMGQVEAILPKKENDLLRIKMDAVGIIDFDQGTASLDAVLYESRLLKKFVLTGGMAMRLRWKGAPSFALAIGGLHHAFNPPANFPRLDRLAINLSAGDNPRITCAAYFAVTSNTVQFGARANLYAAAHGFSIEGDIGFDVLIQLSPFHFLAEFHASVQLKRGSRNLFKVAVEGALEGPRPLRARGKATFEVLWWDVSVSFDKTLVEGAPPPPLPAVDVLGELVAALGDRRNWQEALPVGQRRVATVRELPVPNEVRIHPLGKFGVKQTIVPLNLSRDIDKFGSSPPSGARRFSITSITVGGVAQTPTPLTDFFASAQFFEMTDDESIASPSFDTMDAGLMVGIDGFAFNNSERVNTVLEYETIIVDKQAPAPSPPKPGFKLNRDQLFLHARFGAAARSAVQRTGTAKFQNRARTPEVAVSKPRYAIASTEDLSPQTAPGVEAGKPMTWIDAQEILRKLKQQNPAEAAKRQVVRAYELVR